MKYLALFGFVVGVAACAPTVREIRTPVDVAGEQAVTAMWANEIRGVARDGDWLLGTAGDELSIAAMYDARGSAIAGGGALPIEQLLDGLRSVIVVRPANMTAEDEQLALGRARTGTAADGAALIYWASQTEVRSGAHEDTVTPADLMKYGEVIYWSGKRDDGAIRRIASERALESIRLEQARAVGVPSPRVPGRE